MSKTMQDKETKDKNELIKRLQEIKWFISSGDDRAIDIYPDYETLADFVFQREQEAERRGYMRGCNDMFGDLLGVYNPDKKLFTEWLKNRLKLLEEKNGKQNAR